jgi:multidrug efflux pump subunit AcrA (membrane-fusion protein)
MEYFTWVLVLIVVGTAEVAPKPAEPIAVPDMVIKPVRRVDVPAREAGVLSTVHAREGLTVAEGDLLAKIEDTEAIIAADLAKIGVQVARIQADNDVNSRFARKSVDVSKAELARSEDSNKRYPTSIADSEMDRLRLVVQKDELQVEQADEEHTVAGFTLQAREREHDLARDKVERHRITSPISGIVVDVQRRGGEWVEPGETIATIVRVNRLRAEGFLSVKHASRLTQGQRVQVMVVLSDEPVTPFRGEIVFLDPEVDPVNGQVRIWAEIENDDLRLRPGMRASMTIQPALPKKSRADGASDVGAGDGRKP